MLPIKIWPKTLIIIIVLILDGNYKICYLICLRHLIISRAVKNLIFFLRKRSIFLLTCATFSELPSNTSTIIITLILFWPDWNTHLKINLDLTKSSQWGKEDNKNLDPTWFRIPDLINYFSIVNLSGFDY